MLEPHPLAELFPMLPAGDLDELAADIKRHGLREKIVLLDGMVLDGRNRLRAGLAAGVIDPDHPQFIAGTKCMQMAVRSFDPDEEGDPLAFVLSHNLHRRHLTTSQRAMVAAKIAKLPRGRPDEKAQNCAFSDEKAASQLNVSERSVETAKRVLRDGAEALQAAVEQRKLTVNTAVALASLPKSEQTEVLASADPAAIKTIAKQVRSEQQRLKHAVRLAHMEMTAERGQASAPGKLGKKYAVVYADPPWKFGVRSEVTGREKSAENHYPTMATDEIITLLLELDPFAADCVFFLWATNPMLPNALRVLAECGFAYVHNWVWDKEVAGTGYWGRDRHEHLLIGRRGTVAAPLPGTQPETVHRERKGRHSAKPMFYAETIERLFIGVPKIELFCRAPRAGWDVWGFEARG